MSSFPSIPQPQGSRRLRFGRGSGIGAFELRSTSRRPQGPGGFRRYATGPAFQGAGANIARLGHPEPLVSPNRVLRLWMRRTFRLSAALIACRLGLGPFTVLINNAARDDRIRSMSYAGLFGMSASRCTCAIIFAIRRSRPA